MASACGAQSWMWARDIALKYKQLWQVEAIFRTMKSQLRTRPIFHRCEDTVRGHLFCSFPAVLLRDEPQRRLQAKQWKLQWAGVLRDLDQMQEIEACVQGKK